MKQWLFGFDGTKEKTMAGVPTKGKKQEPTVAMQRGIWLSSEGSLSFGLAREGETLLDQATYDTLKIVPAAGRFQAYLDSQKKPAETVSADTASPVEQVTAAPV
jgi:hypothetical protein